MIAECREIHAPSWTRILLNAQKRFPRVQDLQGGSREVLGHVARISRRAARFSSRNRETIFEVLKNLQRFSENLQRFLENLQRFLENLQRFSENLQRFLEHVGVFQFDCPTLFAVPTASNHVCGLFHNIQQLISSRGVRGACALVW